MFINSSKTHFCSVSAVFAQNDLPPIPNGPESNDGLNLLYHEEVDICLDVISMTPLRFEFLRPTYFFWIEPFYYILGSKYPKRYDFAEKFYQTVNTFDSTFWTLLFFTLITLPLIVTLIKTFRSWCLKEAIFQQTRKRRTYSQRIGYKLTRNFLKNRNQVNSDN